MNVSAWKAVKRDIRILRTTVSTQRTYRQAQLALAVLPRKAADFRDRFANERANVYRLLLRFLGIL